MIYYCIRCKKEIIPVEGYMQHPHLGRTPAKVCPLCHNPVMLRIKKPLEYA